MLYTVSPLLPLHLGLTPADPGTVFCQTGGGTLPYDTRVQPARTKTRPPSESKGQSSLQRSHDGTVHVFMFWKRNVMLIIIGLGELFGGADGTRIGAFLLGRG